LCGPNSTLGENVYIASSEAHMGYRFVQCSRCGEIYAISISNETYMDSSCLDELSCATCRCRLAESLHDYPEQYLKKDGTIGLLDIYSIDIDDEHSVLRDFYQLL